MSFVGLWSRRWVYYRRQIAPFLSLKSRANILSIVPRKSNSNLILAASVLVFGFEQRPLLPELKVSIQWAIAWATWVYPEPAWAYIDIPI